MGRSGDIWDSHSLLSPLLKGHVGTLEKKVCHSALPITQTTEISRLLAAYNLLLTTQRQVLSLFLIYKGGN